jgi:putative membrane protein
VIARFLVTVACNIAALFVASLFIDGVDYGDHFGWLVLAGIVFGLVNALLKPLVTLFTLPFVILTLGIGLFFINMLMLYVTSWIVGPFSIASFWDAFFATIIIWLVNSVLLGGVRRRAQERVDPRRAPPPDRSW